MSKFIVTNRKFLNETSNSYTAAVGYDVELDQWSNDSDLWIDADFTVSKEGNSICFYQSDDNELTILRDMINEYLDALERAKEKKKELENEQAEVQIDV